MQRAGERWRGFKSGSGIGDRRAFQLAWAEAVDAAGPGKVEDLIAKTQRYLPKNPERHVSSVALIHYYRGRAYMALGKTEQAASEFECAARLDPNGNSGRLAKAALAASSNPAPKA